MVYGQFFTDIENLIWLIGLAAVITIIIWGIKYRQKHPYKSKMDKESWLRVFWVCLYKMLTGKKH